MMPVLVLAAASAAAAIDCRRATSDSDMSYCVGIELNKADDELNALYRYLMSHYDPANKALLRTAEEKWVAWRDAECAYETNMSVGGTRHPMIARLCALEKTKAHIKELKGQRDCPVSELTCNPTDR